MKISLLCTVKRENVPILPEEFALKMIFEIDVSPLWEALKKKTFYEHGFLLRRVVMVLSEVLDDLKYCNLTNHNFGGTNPW